MKKSSKKNTPAQTSDAKQPKKLTRATLEALTACAGGRPYPVSPNAQTTI
jgi:hypothetical protein